MNYSNEFNDLINYLFESTTLQEVDKQTLHNEWNVVINKKFESHIYVAYLILKTLKDEGIKYELFRKIKISL